MSAKISLWEGGKKGRVLFIRGVRERGGGEDRARTNREHQLIDRVECPRPRT